MILYNFNWLRNQNQIQSVSKKVDVGSVYKNVFVCPPTTTSTNGHSLAIFLSISNPECPINNLKESCMYMYFMVYILVNFLPRAMMILTLFSFRASASLLMASTSSVNVILPSIKIKFTKLFISIRCIK